MTYEEWERELPEAVKQDVIWRVQAYRLALYLSACAKLDSQSLAGDPRYEAHIPQLCRSAASVAAAIAEGYPRRSAKDRARYYEYALGSLAESKVWYLDIRSALDAPTVDSRFAVIRSITRLLLTMKRRTSTH